MVLSVISQIKEGLSEMPPLVKLFIKRAFLVFIVWELIYLPFLLPDRIIDQPLSLFTANSTVRALNLIYSEMQFGVIEYQERVWKDAWMIIDRTAVIKNDKKLIGIADGCNGLNLFVLFLGFIIAYPNSLKKKFLFGVFGLLLIILINIIRCTGLAIVEINYPEYTIFAHHYIFNITTYLIVFFLWTKFTKI